MLINLFILYLSSFNILKKLSFFVVLKLISNINQAMINQAMINQAMDMQIHRNKGRPGAKHFRTEVKQSRQKEYSINVAIGEFLDHPILNATNIDISIKYKPGTDNNILLMQIADNTPTGFQHLSESNDKNPFNYGHTSSYHDDDESISEFGTGLKEAFIALSDNITILTKSANEYVMILFDIEKMSKVEDVNESYNYDEKLISQSEYEERHKFSCGSSILLEKIVDGIIFNEADTKEFILKTYSKIIRKRNIIVRFNNKVLIDETTIYFDLDYCKPFNSVSKLYAKKNEKGAEDYYMELCMYDKTQYYLYSANVKIPAWKEVTIKKEINKLQKQDNWYPTCFLDGKQIEEIAVISGADLQFCKGDHLTMGEVLLFKRGRQHGSFWPKSRNGGFNHTYLEVEIYSKIVGKEMGMTVNKLLKLNKGNKLCNVVTLAISFMQKRHAYDASTKDAVKKYKIIRETGLDISHIPHPSKWIEPEPIPSPIIKDNVPIPIPIIKDNVPIPIPIIKDSVPIPSPIIKNSVPIPSPIIKDSVPIPSPIIKDSVPIPSPIIKNSVPIPSPIIKDSVPIPSPIIKDSVPIPTPIIQDHVHIIHNPIIQDHVPIPCPIFPVPIIHHVQVKKFKAVLINYINTFQDNENICDDDLYYYTMLCTKLNIPY